MATVLAPDAVGLGRFALPTVRAADVDKNVVV
jgi:hypothetical protein